jgi:hypothetical protein
MPIADSTMPITDSSDRVKTDRHGAESAIGMLWID